MTHAEEIKLVLGAICKYAKLNELNAIEIVDIFNEGVGNFSYPELISPLIDTADGVKEIPLENKISTLQSQKRELKETLGYLPSCEKATQNKILDQILEIDNALTKLNQKLHDK